MIKKVLFIFTCCVFLIAIGCKNKKGGQKGDVTADSSDIVNLDELPDSLRLKQLDSIQKIEAKIEKDSVLTVLTKEIFTDLKQKNYAVLDEYAHPQLGVRISPYTNVDPSTDQVFQKGKFQKLFTTQKNQKLNWGFYDGSGDSIILTPAEYFQRFIYDGNYVNPEKMGVNKIMTKGNTINNLNEVYKDADFTESYISGSKKGQGIDWKSVKLVFKKEAGKYYLVGIIHNEWTI